MNTTSIRPLFLLAALVLGALILSACDSRERPPPPATPPQTQTPAQV